MSRINLSESSGWQLVNNDQDVRGFEALDALGESLGATVKDMIIETDNQRIHAVVLSNGTEHPSTEIALGEGVVYLTQVNAHGPPTARRSLFEDGHVAQRSQPV